MPLPAIITAAAPRHRHILYQTLETSGQRQITIGQSLVALLEDVADRVVLIVPRGDGPRAREAFLSPRLTVMEQTAPHGYAHALHQAREFTGGQAFLHLVGDHFYLAHQGAGGQELVKLLVGIFDAHRTSVSAVQPTHESLLPYFGAIGGPALAAAPQPLYRVETVLEKPTPTEAERRLVVSGLRQGHYLCFFGMHVFTAGLMPILEECLLAEPSMALSPALQLLAQRERYVAAVLPGQRFDIGAPYGLLQAQLSLGLRGPDRDTVLGLMLGTLAQ